MQRLGAEAVGGEIWAGGTDGVVRVWSELGMCQGGIAPRWEFETHDGKCCTVDSRSYLKANFPIDAVSSTTMHPSTTVLATCSGQRQISRLVDLTDLEDDEHDSDDSSLSKSPHQSIAKRQVLDNSLKVWTLQ